MAWLLVSLLCVRALSSSFGEDFDECVNDDHRGPHGAAGKLYDYSGGYFDKHVTATARCDFCKAFVKYKFSSTGPCRTEFNTTLHSDVGTGEHVFDGREIQHRELGFSKCDVNQFVDCQELCDHGAGNYTNRDACTAKYKHDYLDWVLTVDDKFSEPYTRVCAALFTRLGKWGSAVRYVAQQQYHGNISDEDASTICSQYLDSCVESVDSRIWKERDTFYFLLEAKDDDQLPLCIAILPNYGSDDTKWLGLREASGSFKCDLTFQLTRECIKNEADNTMEGDLCRVRAHIFQVRHKEWFLAASLYRRFDTRRYLKLTTETQLDIDDYFHFEVKNGALYVKSPAWIPYPNKYGYAWVDRSGWIRTSSSSARVPQLYTEPTSSTRELATLDAPPYPGRSLEATVHTNVFGENFPSSHRGNDSELLRRVGTHAPARSEYGGGSEISFPDEDNMNITNAVNSSSATLRELTDKVDSWVRDALSHNMSTANFINYVSEHRDILDTVLLFSGTIFLRPLNRELVHMVLTTGNRHEHDKLLVEVVDPTALEGLLTLYGAVYKQFDYFCGVNNIHYNTVTGRMLRGKLSTTSMLAGLQWDTPNAGVREAIRNYLLVYKPAMWEYVGVSHTIEHYREVYTNAASERFSEVLDNLATAFVTYNQFFYRKLKPRTRNCLCYSRCGTTDCDNTWGRDMMAQQWFGQSFVVEENEATGRPSNVVLSPADCRLMVFDTLDTVNDFWIKGNQFTLDTLAPGVYVGGVRAREKFARGSFMIARLAPQDYHRFHWPVGGIISNTTFHDGQLFSVNPLAVRSLHFYRQNDADALVTNKRLSTTLTSDSFGALLYSAIGATMIGSVILTTGEHQTVVAGQEHGYMAHGGSTVAIFFEKKINWRREISENSKMGFETVLKVGEPIGAEI